MPNIYDIQEHMPVLDARGNRVGTVASLHNADEIKLARHDSPDGLYHYIPLEWVDAVDSNVRLKKTSADVIRERQG